MLNKGNTFGMYDFIKGNIHNMYTGKDIDEEIYLSFFTDKNVSFEILSEEDKEIDIQSIELFDEIRDVSDWSNNTLSHNQRSIISKVNKIIKAIKQLDKK